ncbi:hypothetical protein UCRPA7_7413 [Phaeoacremonium minimum UCRPA7]|uniref:SWR1-complex protein 3 domain-containing protein n=1 Tax=Phaeoacremonium minimum (strain UCR-PA7) TaxID=1286976 RepID=R8BCP9_PHAM7|nr:hypothetical protein UCRPA7_7413 [Phaeoacremonium minimum UCRPA7]EON97084.1 hypothetical protein UCRPA7_7413 [Phaeoacremonium minimum UCRPA7]
MERKRKLPARAAARVEHIAKKRTATPPDNRSATPASAPTPAPEEPPPPAPAPAQLLPKSIQAGKPLPTVEDPQPADLPEKDYQSVQESGVLAESLSRSRQRWISEGIFEKYWSKPSKRKGVVIEEPNNPSKDTMIKLGPVTITVEPHVFEATMFAVKDPKPPPPQPVFRPIMQYGPPNGTMPPPPTPSTANSTPAPPASLPQPSQPQTPGPPAPPPPPPPASAQAPPIASSSIPHAPPNPVPSPRGMEGVLSPSTATPQPVSRPMVTQSPAVVQHSQPSPSPIVAPAIAPVPPVALPPSYPPRSPAPGAGAPTPPISNGAPTPSARPAQPAGTDPIIVTLAEKATEDPQLRDLMKRVANGAAPKEELERFQAIIDQITAESKRKGGQQGPSADRLLVDGRTVRYFADEVRVILDIVYATNPKQTSADLRPPEGSDPLIVLLVKTALDDAKTRDMVRRIAENRPLFSDATDLKALLDRLKNRVIREREYLKSQALSQSPVPSKGSGAPNGLPSPSLNMPGQGQRVQTPPQQALRSKGPPPVVKPDISAIVFEFAGGSGDRYLFPKFSILEYVQSPAGQQVIASFLIVRKGSTSEYGGDPALDYYQPVTIRLWSPAGKHLDSLAKVVAPPDEVQRYMDDIMDNMTRAEYILLAMRLPKGDKEVKEDGEVLEKEKPEEANSVPPETKDQNPWQRRSTLLWKTEKLAKAAPLRLPSLKDNRDEDERYQSFVASVSRKMLEEEV